MQRLKSPGIPGNAEGIHLTVPAHKVEVYKPHLARDSKKIQRAFSDQASSTAIQYMPEVPGAAPGCAATLRPDAHL